VNPILFGVSGGAPMKKTPTPIDERMPWPADYFGVQPKSPTCCLGDAMKGVAIPKLRVNHNAQPKATQ
jgi:diadenosine tetraphosphatase ApaH/serine/threonine PP2A family protein phosphatase